MDLSSSPSSSDSNPVIRNESDQAQPEPNINATATIASNDNQQRGFDGTGKYLLSGGIAGAVSRTATAPFDRLKIYLITAQPQPTPHFEVSRTLAGSSTSRLSSNNHHPSSAAAASSSFSMINSTHGNPKPTVSNLINSLKLIYHEHSQCHQYQLSDPNNQSNPNNLDALSRRSHKWGIRNFFIGNGLNVIKVFPESAIKFFVYEYTKNLFDRRYHLSQLESIPEPTSTDAIKNNLLVSSSSSSSSSNDNSTVDPNHQQHQYQIHRSNLSRFLAGGLAGVVSQVLIYPIETLKTQLMSSTNNERFQGRKLLFFTIDRLNRSGGFRSYYKGLVPAMIGVFPYSAIDMSTFEGLKRWYERGTGEEAGVVITLLSGAISGGLGATIVYPLNVIRTRLQAQGTEGHPRRYSGIMDCIKRTIELESWNGFYRGLIPSLLKVIPAVSISWLVYEQSNRILDPLFSS